MKPPTPPVHPLAAQAQEQRLAAWPVVEDWKPLHESALWALNRGFWQTTAQQAFAGGKPHDQVPYLATSDGSLSVATAQWLLALVRQRRAAGQAGGRLGIVEFGPGSGLFARILGLRWAQERLADAALPELDYLAVDASAQMLAAIEARGLLAIDGVNARFEVLDLGGPAAAVSALIQRHFAPGTTVLAVANYLLDSLPSMLLRRQSGHVTETWVELRARSGAEARLDDGRWMARTRGEPADFNDRFVGLASRHLVEDGQQLPVNRSALTLIETLATALGDDGHIIVNDYAATPHSAASAGWQTFAGSIAMGIHFPVLDDFAQGVPGWTSTAATDGHAAVEARWLAARPNAELAAAFRDHFGQAQVRHAHALVATARAAHAGRRWGEAAAHYEAAVAALPENWSIATEAAGFMLEAPGLLAAAAPLAQWAVHGNPLCAAAWNVLGDAAYRADDWDEAARAYARADDVSGGQARARLNLAYCASRQGRLDEALGWIARALVADADGPLTAEILRRQAEIITRLRTPASASGT